ncbi:MAG: N-acetyltransferase [Bacteroidetes bacterium]|nr:MAG: N-acetyltransferase [Bacteroidota bacterium]
MDVINNTRNQQFEVYLDDHLAVLQYRLRENRMYFMHTGVPEAIGGRGVASALARTGLEHARKEGLKIVVYCPYVRAYLKRHPEYSDLLDQGTS